MVPHRNALKSLAILESWHAPAYPSRSPNPTAAQKADFEARAKSAQKPVYRSAQRW